MESILTKVVPGQLRTYAAIILMFTYTILIDREFACTCKDQNVGYWYVCCQNDGSEQQAKLACKDKTNITYDNRLIIAELKNESRLIGGCVLFCIVLVAALTPLFGWNKCCGKSSCCNRKVVYGKLILEEEENVLEEILRKSAKEKLTKEVEEKIRAGQWEDSFDVAEKLIKESRPTAPEQEKQEKKELRLTKLKLQVEKLQHKNLQLAGPENPEGPGGPEEPGIPPEPVRPEEPEIPEGPGGPEGPGNQFEPEDLPLLAGNPGSSDEQ